MHRTFRINAWPIAFVAACALLFLSQEKIHQCYQLPFPHFEKLLTKKSGFQDAAFIVSGFRGIAADVAWVQLLQNMGDYGNADEKNVQYPYLKNDTLRVTRIDPYFRSAYLFGAATLAYLQNVNRPQEALDVLSEGIHYNPNYWPFQKFAEGIGYKETNQFEKMVEMLEESVRHPECPTMVKAILANAYKLHKRYADAIALWEAILADENGRDYHQKALDEIPKLRAMMEQK